jgi:hypothetical protein
MGGSVNPVEVHSPQDNVLHVSAPRLAYMAAPAAPPVSTGVLYLDTGGILRLRSNTADTVVGGGTHPDLATHDALGLATQAELDAAIVFRGALYRNTSTQSIATGVSSLTQVVLASGGSVFDPKGYLSISTNQFIVPAGQAGWHVVSFDTEFASNATGGRRWSIRRNGTNMVQTQNTSSMAQPFSSPLVYQDNLAVGDVIDFYVAQSSGANLVLNRVSASIQKLT